MSHIISFYGCSAIFVAAAVVVHFFICLFHFGFFFVLGTKPGACQIVTLLWFICIVWLATSLCHSLLSVIICFCFLFHFFISPFLLHSSSLSFGVHFFGVVFAMFLFFFLYVLSHIRSDNTIDDHHFLRRLVAHALHFHFFLFRYFSIVYVLLFCALAIPHRPFCEACIQLLASCAHR